MPRKRCPNGTRLNKKTNRCNKIKRVTLKKRCPKGTRKNFKTGKCEGDKQIVVVKKSTPKKRSRCPNGTRKNPKTGNCESIQPTVKIPPVRKEPPPVRKEPSPIRKEPTTVQPALPEKPKKRSRCPKGTRKNPKTGNCESIKIKEVLDQSVVKVEKEADIKTLSQNIIEKIEGLEEDKERTRQKSLTVKEFSPLINIHLNSINMKTPDVLVAFGCTKSVSKKIQEKLKQKTYQQLLKEVSNKQYVDTRYPNIFKTILKASSASDLNEAKKKMIKMLSNPPDVDKILTVVSGKPVCKKWNDKVLKESMLKNLNSTKEIDFSRIRGPKQYLSNCWFNTAFMSFFISDKGRKFTRAYRKDMIEGKMNKLLDTKTYTSLQKVFVVYNTLIDNCLRGVLDVSVNNNFVIASLFKITKSRNMYGPNNSGNPINFFRNMIHLLDCSTKSYSPKFYYSVLMYKESEIKDEFLTLSKNYKTKYGITESYPDCLIFEIFDNAIKPEQKKKFIKKLIKFKTSSGGNVKYVLDAAVIRDNSKEHFTSYLTGHGVEYRFEGHSHSGVKPFKWKSLITKDQNFNFSDDETPRRWTTLDFNFMKGYHILFYYRV